MELEEADEGPPGLGEAERFRWVVGRDLPFFLKKGTTIGASADMCRAKDFGFEKARWDEG